METQILETKHPSRTACFSATWTRTIRDMHAAFLHAFLHPLTQFSARNPKTVNRAIALVSIAAVMVGLATNFYLETDEDVLFTPQDSLPVSHHKWIETTSGFAKKPRLFRLLFHKEGDSVLDIVSVRGLLQTVDAVTTLPLYRAVCAQSDYTDLDGQPTCPMFGVGRFWNYKSTLFEANIGNDHEALVEALSASTYADGTPVPASSQAFGLPQRDPVTNRLTYVASYQVTISIPSAHTVAQSPALEEEAIDVVLDISAAWQQANKELRLEVVADRSFSDEFERAIVVDIPLVPIVFVVMSIFTALVFARWRNPVQSRALLGVGAVVCVTCSIMTGYGVMFIAGVNFTSMTQILPFIFFGVGLDDAFVIMGAYTHTNASLHVTARIRATVQEVGTSITLTSLTSTLAFGLGCTSSIPAVDWLCLYAFPTIIVVYLTQLTFFVGCIVLDERRIQERRRDCCTCITATVVAVDVASTHDDEVEEENEDPREQEKVHPSNIHHHNDGRMLAPVDVPSNALTVNEDATEFACVQMNVDEEEESSNVVPDNKKKGSHQERPEETIQHPEPPLEKFMDWYSNFILQPKVKVCVVVAFTALAVLCGFSVSMLTQEFKFTDVVPSDSYVKDFFDAFNVYSSGNLIAPYAYFRNVDQSDAAIQTQMQAYVADLVALDRVPIQPDFFWLTDFQDFVQKQNATIAHMSFEEQLDAFLAIPEYQALYGQDIIRDETTRSITASRVQMSLDLTSDDEVNENVDYLQSQRAISADQIINQASSELSFFTYHSLYNIWGKRCLLLLSLPFRKTFKLTK